MISDISTQACATTNQPARIQKTAAEDPLPEPIVACDSTVLARAAEEALSGDPLQGAPLSPGREKWEKIKAGMSEKAEETADFLDRHPVLQATLSGGEQVLKGIKAFPQFIYPTFQNMTAQEADYVMSVLDGLPLKDVNSVKHMEILPEIEGASGLAYRNPADPFIQLNRQQMNISPGWFKEVTIHEVGHTKDYSTSLFGMFRHESSTNPLWGKPPYISDYSKTNHWESFAESYASYYMRPEKLKAECPEKFKRIQEMEELGVFEKLTDQKAFRETGKYIGEKLGGIPYLRQGVSLISFVFGFLQVARGFGELQQGAHTGDLKKKMDGTLDIAAGTCFASKIFCVPGLAVDGAKQALDRAIDRGDITAEQGNALVQHTVGLVGQPFAAALKFIKTRIFKGPETPKPDTPPASDPEKKLSFGTLAKATSIAVGGAAGSLTGGVLGPYAGLMAGFSLAGPLGGAIGLVAGCIAGIYAGNRAGGELGTIIGDLFVQHREKKAGHADAEAARMAVAAQQVTPGGGKPAAEI